MECSLSEKIHRPTHKWPFSSLYLSFFYTVSNTSSVKLSMIGLPTSPVQLPCSLCPAQASHTSRIAPMAENHHHLLYMPVFPIILRVLSEQGVGLIHLYILSPGLAHRRCFINIFLNEEYQGLSSIYL